MHTPWQLVSYNRASRGREPDPSCSASLNNHGLRADRTQPEIPNTIKDGGWQQAILLCGLPVFNGEQLPNVKILELRGTRWICALGKHEVTSKAGFLIIALIRHVSVSEITRCRDTSHTFPSHDTSLGERDREHGKTSGSERRVPV
jgi:hypothetical protein